MKKLIVNEQTIFCVESENTKLFYNNTNGKIAYYDSVGEIESSFFEAPKDIFMEPQPIEYEQLYLAVSENCNFRCKYCRQRKTGELVNMTLKEIQDAIDKFLSVAKTPKSVVFFGGEPLMNFPGIKFAIEYIKAINNKVKFSMVINGSLCTEEMAEFFAKNDVEVIVSMDGPESIHNSSRVYGNGNGTYYEALRGYKRLKKAGCRTGITAVIGPHNEKNIKLLTEWVLELKPDSLGFCLPHGDDDNYAMKVESFENIHESFIDAYNIFHKNNIYLVQVEQKVEAFIRGYVIYHECKSCGKRLVACKNNKYGNCEGPITNHDCFYDNLEEVEKKIMMYKQSTPLLNDECKSCPAYRICGGSCVYDKITRFGKPNAIDITRCGLNKKIVERALEHMLEISDTKQGVLTSIERERIFCKYMEQNK